MDLKRLCAAVYAIWACKSPGMGTRSVYSVRTTGLLLYVPYHVRVRDRIISETARRGTYGNEAARCRRELDGDRVRPSSTALPRSPISALAELLLVSYKTRRVGL